MAEEIEKSLNNSSVEETAPVVRSYPLAKERAESLGGNPRLLATMPLGALLPQLGELSYLYQVRDELKERYKEVLAETASAANEAARESAAEASMLNQVLQWLSHGVREE